MRSVDDLLVHFANYRTVAVEVAVSSSASHSDLITSLGLCIGVAAVCALIASKFKQPPLLAYLVAGLLIGPEIGFGWIDNRETIEVISEIGLILLLFIIGVEIDLKKLRSSGKPVLMTGVVQFVACVVLG